MKVLVTGATGFIGSGLVKTLEKNHDIEVVAAVRTPAEMIPDSIKQISNIDIGPDTDWTVALQEVTHVVHLAGVTPGSTDSQTETSFELVNYRGASRLAEQAIDAGIKNFVYISSIGVNGQTTSVPFTNTSPKNPDNLYARSKSKAEDKLQELFEPVESGSLTIIRPPLVYGPHVSGKFRQLLGIASKSIPIPLGSVHNRRSFVAVDNLVDLIVTCLEKPKMANGTFLVSDGEDISTTDLLRRINKILGTYPMLVPFPAGVLSSIAALLGKKSVAQGLCDNLQVDITHTCKTLGWSPPVMFDAALEETVNAFVSDKRNEK